MNYIYIHISELNIIVYGVCEVLLSGLCYRLKKNWYHLLIFFFPWRYSNSLLLSPI